MLSYCLARIMGPGKYIGDALMSQIDVEEDQKFRTSSSLDAVA